MTNALFECSACQTRFMDPLPTEPENDECLTFCCPGCGVDWNYSREMDEAVEIAIFWEVIIAAYDMAERNTLRLSALRWMTPPTS